MNDNSNHISLKTGLLPTYITGVVLLTIYICYTSYTGMLVPTMHIAIFAIYAATYSAMTLKVVSKALMNIASTVLIAIIVLNVFFYSHIPFIFNIIACFIYAYIILLVAGISLIYLDDEAVSDDSK